MGAVVPAELSGAPAQSQPSTSESTRLGRARVFACCKAGQGIGAFAFLGGEAPDPCNPTIM